MLITTPRVQFASFLNLAFLDRTVMGKNNQIHSLRVELVVVLLGLGLERRTF